MAAENIVQAIPIEQIYRNPHQPRKSFPKASLEELAESIREHGVIQPITVEFLPGKLGTYMLVAGERRWRASKLASKTTIRAIVQDQSNHNGRERLIVGIVENVQREDMNPIDEAEAYGQLRDYHQMNPAEIAQSVGKSTTHIYVALQRLLLHPKVQGLIRDGSFTADRRVVSALIDLQNPAAQVGLVERALQRRMTITGILRAIADVKVALEAKKLKKTSNAHSPAMTLAATKHDIDIDDETPPVNWNALMQLGKVPSWKTIVAAADHTCDCCELRKMASEEICGPCPLVEMLAHLTHQGQEGVS